MDNDGYLRDISKAKSVTPLPNHFPILIYNPSLAQSIESKLINLDDQQTFHDICDQVMGKSGERNQKENKMLLAMTSEERVDKLMLQYDTFNK